MPQDAGQTLVAIATGVCLSAACGFRVFVPLFALSLATRLGYVHPAEGWKWVGDLPALITLGTATVVEIAAFYVPWVDHLLDTIAAPAALIAGTLATAALLDVNPTLKWSLAILAGGGSAGIVQGLTMVTRAASTATTGGVGNPVVATGEAAGSILIAVLAIAIPIITLILVLVFLFFSVRFVIRTLKSLRRKPSAVPPAEPQT